MSGANEALFILRAVFGLSMLAHGANKIRGGVDGTERWFAGIGMRLPRVQALTAAGTETVSGLFLAFGLFTAPACVAIISLMLVAIITVHRKVGYFIFLPGGGWEYCAAIAAVATALSLTGPGEWSLDHLLDAPISSGAWALPLSVLLTAAHLAVFWRSPSDASRS